jgi:hypothetical protein
MRRLHLLGALALIFTALAVTALLGLNLASGLVAGLYRNTPGLSVASTAARITAAVAALGLLTAMGSVAVGAALTPGGWLRKAALVLPLFLLVLAIIGALLAGGGFGMTGTLALGSFALPLSGLVTLVAGLGAILALSIATAAVPFDTRFLRLAIGAANATAVMAVVSTVAIGVTAWMISTSQPSFAGEGGFGRPPGGFAPGGEQAPGAQGTSPGSQPQPFGQGRSGFPEGGFRRVGGFSVLGNVGRILPIGGAVAGVLSIVGLGFGLVGLRSMRMVGSEAIVSAEAPGTRAGGEIARAVAALCGVGAVVLILIQLIPAPRTNPPVQTAVAWDSPQTKDLFYRACADCHSNETTWPWYSALAPASWLTSIDVNSGRRQFNVSEQSGGSRFGNDVAERIQSGSMPPKDYLFMHPAARLTEAEKQQLIQGLQNSLR